MVDWNAVSTSTTIALSKELGATRWSAGDR